MTLDSITREPAGLVAKYEVSHSTPGRDGTTLTASCTIMIRGKCYASLAIDSADGKTPDEALDKMATWLRRLADGIEQRTHTMLPL